MCVSQNIIGQVFSRFTHLNGSSSSLVWNVLGFVQNLFLGRYPWTRLWQDCVISLTKRTVRTLLVWRRIEAYWWIATQTVQNPARNKFWWNLTNNLQKGGNWDQTTGRRNKHSATVECFLLFPDTSLLFKPIWCKHQQTNKSDKINKTNKSNKVHWRLTNKISPKISWEQHGRPRS